MKVNRNNYEVFLIDYIEGKLDASQEAELLLFLKANPDIKEEFAEFENISIETNKISFAEKESLKQVPIQVVGGIGEENYEHFFTAYCEGDLSEKEQIDLLHFLSVNTQLKPEFEIHKHLKVEADQAVLYPQHEELKRKRAIAPWWWSSGAVAAAIALLFAISYLINSEGVVHERQFISIVPLDLKSETKLTSDLSIVQLAARTSRPTQILTTSHESERVTEIEKINIATIEPKLIAMNLSDNSRQAEPLQSIQTDEFTILVNNEPIQGEKKKSLFGRILKRQVELLAEKSPVKKKKTKSNDPTFIKILDGGITAFNTVTGSEVEMKKAYDNKGNLKAYQLENDGLIVSRNIPLSGKAE